VYHALQNQQENMEEPAVIILSEINNQSHLLSLLLNKSWHRCYDGMMAHCKGDFMNPKYQTALKSKI
jgi:hypothetical protein